MLQSSFEMRGMEERKDENPLSRVIAFPFVLRTGSFYNISFIQVIEQSLSGRMGIEEPSGVSGEQPHVEVRSERTNMVMTIIQQEFHVQVMSSQ